MIKRAYANWKKLRTPAYYRQTALFTMTNNYIEEKIIHKINDLANDENTEYIKLCTTCLQEEDGIIHKMSECPPVNYINQTISDAVSEFTGIRISNRNAQRRPNDQTRLIFFMDLPPVARKERNKETELLMHSIAAVSNIATATARKIWIQKHIRKPTIEYTQQITRQTMQTIAQCYYGQPENNILTTIMQKIISIFANDIKGRKIIEYQIPSKMDKILVEQHMIPTFIYEEAQGNAFIRSIDEYERENEKRLPIFQEIINKLFEAINATYERKKLL